MDGDTSEIMGNNCQEESSFGISKIIDVRIGEDGKQMYKVKWEPTWEPVENLVTCQHLIDEFWSFVNIAKVRKSQENTRQTNRSGLNLNMNTAEKILKISEDDKSDVQRLIARTNSSSAGNPTLISPKLMLDRQNQQMANLHGQACHQNQDQKSISFDSTSQYISTKKEGLQSSNIGFSSVKDSGSKYAVLRNCIENFNSPYVKIIIVCKICNKEESLKLSRTWKSHYLTHASNEEKPHKCPHCPKAFIQPVKLRQHLKTHGKTIQSNVKGEQFI